ncbi:DUF3618 domain-containing protein [Aureimonas sp. AU12]|uniref:DUF3618 domain-containing protein n=1 Tax=Aureimonas sp. AU12 TaxID=1638161 RepID=UPI00078543D3|nr:DUF3618 domain-containing protein [Aureimonas sp. AU12]
MSTETERLAREAEERRSSLDSTLDSLKDRFSPGQIVDEVAAYVRGGQGAEMVQNLNRQVRDNPLALGLIGAGAAWLLLGQGVRDNGSRLKSRYDDRRDDDRTPDRWAADDRDNRFDGPVRPVATAYTSDYGSDLAQGVPRAYAGAASRPSSSGGPGLGERARQGATSAGDSVSSAASDAAGAVSDAASSAAGAVSDAASSVASGVSHLGHEASDAAHRAAEAGYRSASYAGERVSDYGARAKRTFLDTLQEEPLILGAVAVAIGAAIGAAFPSTRTEDEWLGETRDRLRDEAIDYGRDAVQKAETVAAKAYEAGSAEAEEKGLKPEAGSGETIAQKVSSVVKTAAETGKDEARKEGLS